MKEKVNNRKILRKGSFVLSLIFLSVSCLYPQTQDSLLLEKINNIDVNLAELDENTIENLYLSDVSFTTFYDALSPLGEWIQITKDEVDEDLKDGEGQSYSSLTEDEEFLFIWKPAAGNAGWKPYSNGKWIYTNQGWLWSSNESYGWAVYHYGRWWNNKKYGWVWLPGKVWSPAWVQWRVTDDNIGWVPLNPNAKWKDADGLTVNNYSYKNKDNDWVFISKSDMTDDISSGKIISSNENSKLLSRSQKILDIKNDNSRIINKGPDVKDIETRTGKVIRPRDINVQNAKGKHVIGDSYVGVYREKFKKAAFDNSGKPKFDKPKKYKKSKKVRKMLKRKKIDIRRPNKR